MPRIWLHAGPQNIKVARHARRHTTPSYHADHYLVVYDPGVYGAGTVVDGKYRIERVLGEGGMGVVFAATHIHLGTPVALKFLHHELTRQAPIVERFMREARASAQLRGENVCRVADVGVVDNGPPFIVMELLAG